MQFRNNIIQTALLGTEKKQIESSDLPEELRVSYNNIEKEDSDKETKFLKGASFALNFHKSGVQPFKLQLNSDESPEEEHNYVSGEAIRILKETLGYKYQNLTWFWGKKCQEKNLIVLPHVLPELFEWGVSTKKYTAELFRSVIGKRGLWLSKFSEEWSFVREENEACDWETGTIQQRVNYLTQLRNENPVSAIEKIQSVWKEENAANRLELLESLIINISKSDEEFLFSLLNDKSQKVKEKVLQLLKLIPDSKIIQTYQEILKDSVRISQGKMLGLINKINIEVKLKMTDEAIFKSGIQNLSSNKKISDDDYILMQLTSEVPPSFWEKHFGCDPAEAVKLFSSKDDFKIFREPICQSVFKFSNQAWAREIIEQFDSPPVRLLQLIVESERIKYADKFLKNNDNLNDLVNILRTENVIEWNKKFTKELLVIMAENPNYYNKNYFESISMYLPSSIVNDLDSITPNEEWKRNHWSKISQEIKEYINIKEKIKTIL